MVNAAGRRQHTCFLRFNPAFAEELLAGSGHTYKELAELAAAGKPLPRFPLPSSLRVRLKFDTSDLSSENVLGFLPGSEPALAGEYIVVSAHLDGYGIGEPWNGDRIYNGAFDDAAYVATLIDFAEKLHSAKKPPRRPILFAVWTGEEKGLLGSRYYVGASHHLQREVRRQREPRSATSDLSAQDADHVGDRRLDLGRHGAAGCRWHEHPHPARSGARPQPAPP
jgi:hypothetical protein